MGDYFPENDTPNKIKEDSSEQVDIKQILKSKREESLLCDSGKYSLNPQEEEYVSDDVGV